MTFLRFQPVARLVRSVYDDIEDFDNPRGLTASVLFAALAAAVPLAAPRPPQAATARAQSAQTALDRYVAAPDPNFAWKIVRELPAEGATATLLEMTSQKWLTEQEVERPLWTHWLTVVTAEKVTSDIGVALHQRRQPTIGSRRRAADVARRAARDTGTVVAELRMVPNQPVVFKDDPGAEAADRGRLHRLHLGQVPAHRRREVAGAAADDQERRARDGRRHRVRRVSRRRRPARSSASSSPAPRSAAGRRGRPRPSTRASSPSRRR